jgi:hypothetical protein
MGSGRSAKSVKQRRQRVFLAAFAATGSVKEAAAAAGVYEKTPYRWVKDDAVYRAALEGIEEDVGQTLENEAIRRAHEGVARPVMYKGKPVRTGRGNSRILYETEYSDQLLLALLKRFRPALYRERTQTEVTGSIDLVDRMQAARRRLVEMKRDDGSTATG